MTDPTWEQVKADIAHICGENQTAPRFDPAMTEEQRRSFENLMLLCPNCHRKIDRLKPKDHPVALLREMKAEHEERAAPTERWASEEALARVAQLLLAAESRGSNLSYSMQADSESNYFGVDRTSFFLESIEYNGGTVGVPRARVTLLTKRQNEKIESTSEGNGEIDAVVNAIKQATGVNAEVIGCEIQEKSDGDVGYYVGLLLNWLDTEVIGYGTAPDIIAAAAAACLQACNKILAETAAYR